MNSFYSCLFFASIVLPRVTSSFPGLHIDNQKEKIHNYAKLITAATKMRARNSYLLAILSGVLLLLSFPPFRFGGFLAWTALVPLLIAIYYQLHIKSADRLAEIAGLGFLPVLIFCAPWLQELLSLADLAWLAFVLGIALAIFIAMFLVLPWIIESWKPKHLPSKSLQHFLEQYSGLQIFVLPVAWTATEFLIMNVPGVMRLGGAFGFFSIAKTQWLNPPILQLASFTGMYGVTFLILLVNCAIAYGIVHYQETRRISKQAVAVLLVFVLVLAYGLISIPERVEGDINVAIIQTPLTEEENLPDTYRSLTEKSLKYEPRIVMWPTSTFVKLSVETFVDFSKEQQIYLADGDAIVYPDGKIEHHNFGYHFISLPEQISSGDIYHVFFPDIYGFDTDLGKVGVTDCIESASTLPANDLAKQGVEFLIVPTGSPNDYLFSWVLGSNAIYRAAEHRICAASVIGDYTGSMIVDPYGRILEDIAPEPEIVAGKIAFTDQKTFYSKYGDVFGWTIVGLFAPLIGYNLYLKRKSPYTFCKKCKVQIEKGTTVCPECGKKQ